MLSKRVRRPSALPLLALSFVGPMGAACNSSAPLGSTPCTIEPTSTEEARGHYTKRCAGDGPVIYSGAAVPNEALFAARSIVDAMIGPRPEMKAALARAGAYVAILGESEELGNLPEYAGIGSDMPRGVGGSQATVASTENLLCFPSQTPSYDGFNILVHEIAHTIHSVALASTDPTFDADLSATFDDARRKGLWADTYAGTSHREYWAQGVAIFFGGEKRRANPPNGVWNDIASREELAHYDPGLYALVVRVFGEASWAGPSCPAFTAPPSGVPCEQVPTAADVELRFGEAGVDVFGTIDLGEEVPAHTQFELIVSSRAIPAAPDRRTQPWAPSQASRFVHFALRGLPSGHYGLGAYAVLSSEGGVTRGRRGLYGGTVVLPADVLRSTNLLTVGTKAVCGADFGLGPVDDFLWLDL